MLKKITNPATTPILRKTIHNTNPIIRTIATYSLGNNKKTQNIKLLQTLLNNINKITTATQINITKLKNPRTQTILQQIITTNHQNNTNTDTQ